MTDRIRRLAPLLALALALFLAACKNGSGSGY
jgi:predicted small secreted protein